MKPNDVITNVKLNQTLTLLVSAKDTGGARNKYEITMPAHADGPYAHFHTEFKEVFTVTKGTLDFYLGNDKVLTTLTEGQSITAEIGQLHAFKNNSDAPVSFTVEGIPAGGFVNAFQMACGVAKEGKAGADGLPANLLEKLYFIRLTRGFLPRVPVFIQKRAFSLATFLLALTGRKKRLDSYIS